MERWLVLALALLIFPAPAGADRKEEMERLVTLGDQAINSMMGLQNAAGKHLKACLGFAANETVVSCNEAQVAGTGLVCPAAQPVTTNNAACRGNLWIRLKGSLSYLAKAIVEFDDSVTVEMRVADRRTTIGGHSHLPNGSLASCSADYIERQDFFRVHVAVFQGKAGSLTFPTDPNDDATAATLKAKAQAQSGTTIDGPKVARCIKKKHPKGTTSCKLTEQPREPREEPRTEER